MLLSLAFSPNLSSVLVLHSVRLVLLFGTWGPGFQSLSKSLPHSEPVGESLSVTLVSPGFSSLPSSPGLCAPHLQNFPSFTGPRFLPVSGHTYTPTFPLNFFDALSTQKFAFTEIRGHQSLKCHPCPSETPSSPAVPTVLLPKLGPLPVSDLQLWTQRTLSPRQLDRKPRSVS